MSFAVRLQGEGFCVSYSSSAEVMQGYQLMNGEWSEFPVLLAAAISIGQTLLGIHCDRLPDLKIAQMAASATDDYYPRKYEWAALVYRNHRIISVGGRKLPVALQLPSNLNPLGSSALLETYSQGNKLGFSVFFAKDQEATIKNWSNGFPKNCPFPQGSYILGSLRHYSRNLGGKEHLWINSISAKGSFDYVNVGFQPAEMPSPAEAAPYMTGADDFSVNARHTLSAWKMVGSPIRNQNKFVELDVFFHNATGRVK